MLEYSICYHMLKGWSKRGIPCLNKLCTFDFSSVTVIPPICKVILTLGRWEATSIKSVRSSFRQSAITASPLALLTSCVPRYWNSHAIILCSSLRLLNLPSLESSVQLLNTFPLFCEPFLQLLCMYSKRGRGWATATCSSHTPSIIFRQYVVYLTQYIVFFMFTTYVIQSFLSNLCL